MKGCVKFLDVAFHQDGHWRATRGKIKTFKQSLWAKVVRYPALITFAMQVTGQNPGAVYKIKYRWTKLNK